MLMISCHRTSGGRSTSARRPFSKRPKPWTAATQSARRVDVERARLWQTGKHDRVPPTKRFRLWPVATQTDAVRRRANSPHAVVGQAVERKIDCGCSSRHPQQAAGAQADPDIAVDDRRRSFAAIPRSCVHREALDDRRGACRLSIRRNSPPPSAANPTACRRDPSYPPAGLGHERAGAVNRPLTRGEPR